jgi:UPF0271 protein
MQITAEKESSKNRVITSIDFNSDAAQGFGVFNNNNEEQVSNYVSSVNIATGFHAGDPVSIKKAVLAAKAKGLAIGAHIGYNDLQGFGKRPMNLSEDELEALVVYQVGALLTFANAYGGEIEYVRPHGAMYKAASEDFTLSCAIAKAIKKCSKWLIYYGAAGDVLEKTGDYVNIRVAHEIKLNKVYDIEGKIDYSSTDLTDKPAIINRLHSLLKTSKIDNNSNGFSTVKVDTIHFSGTPDTVSLAKRASEIIKPIPVNFIKAKQSGWV